MSFIKNTISLLQDLYFVVAFEDVHVTVSLNGDIIHELWRVDYRPYRSTKNALSNTLSRQCTLRDLDMRGSEFFMLNSTEHEIFPAYKCKNANNCWHCNIYEQEK